MKSWFCTDVTFLLEIKSVSLLQKFSMLETLIIQTK